MGSQRIKCKRNQWCSNQSFKICHRHRITFDKGHIREAKAFGSISNVTNTDDAREKIDIGHQLKRRGKVMIKEQELSNAVMAASQELYKEMDKVERWWHLTDHQQMAANGRHDRMCQQASNQMVLPPCHGMVIHLPAMVLYTCLPSCHTFACYGIIHLPIMVAYTMR